MLKSHGLKPRTTSPLSDVLLEAWRRTIDRLGLTWQLPPGTDSTLEARYLRAVASMRSGSLESAEQQLADLLRTDPGFATAFEKRGEVLDRMGECALAQAAYQAARTSRAHTRRGMPDRHFALRHGIGSLAEIAGYTRALRDRKYSVVNLVNRGNAYLAMGHHRLALMDYLWALKGAPGAPQLLTLKGEALAALGQYGQALQALDEAIAADSRNPEIHGSRAIIRLALGRLGDADADWRQQLILLPQENATARACVLLRLADYGQALPELERAIEREPNDPYWALYRTMAIRRLRANEGTVPCDGFEAWPGPLLALLGGRLSADELLRRADTNARRTEALFQLGIVSHARDRNQAADYFARVVRAAPPDMIEHAAARHEIVNLGSENR